ncbi:MAG: chorismate synthase [Clostridiales bacterium]|nr:chorismate synthase [Clostridiales bacterium]
MSSLNGNKLNITIFGESHSEVIGVDIVGFPKGVKIDREFLASFMKRRAPGQAFSTPRKEPDLVEFIDGVDENDITTGKIRAIIKNTNTRSGDYDNLKYLPRPSHGDFVSYLKYGEDREVSGGGKFSGRLTALLCIVGALCITLLKEKGINIGAHLLKVGNVEDKSYSYVNEIIDSNQTDFPVIDKTAGDKMKELISLVRSEEDSIGAVVECKVTGMIPAIGGPYFDGVENNLARIMFAIPGVKGFEIGGGFEVAKRKGSENNDQFRVKDGKIVTLTNNDGGINGGITNGMPIVFKVAFKPTPSISKEQQSVNLKTLTEEKLVIKGRHDPCIGVRAVPVVEACAGIALLDMLL